MVMRNSVGSLTTGLTKSTHRKRLFRAPETRSDPARLALTPERAALGEVRPEAGRTYCVMSPLFADLGKRDLGTIARAAKVARVPAGQMIVREGFSAEAFCVLLTGRATVHRDGIDIATLSRGDFLGELGLLDGTPRTASVVASTSLWAVRLPRERFLALLDDEPSITRGILATLAERLRRLKYKRAQSPPARRYVLAILQV